MGAVFRNALVAKKLVNSNLEQNSTAAILQDRFAFYSSVLRNFVKHSQTVEHKTKPEVILGVNKVADRLIEKYKFGAKFLSDIHQFIDDSYHQSSDAVLESIKLDANLTDESFNNLMVDLKGSKLINDFDGRFKAILM